MKHIAIFFLLAAVMVLSGCSDYWQAQGDAARQDAVANQTRAQAERQNAEANVVDAQARSALAASQAQALTSAMSTNKALTDQAIALASNQGSVVPIVILALAAIAAVAGVAIFAMRRPVVIPNASVSQPRGFEIATPQGIVLLLPYPGEAKPHFAWRVQEFQDAVNNSQYLLTDGKDQQQT